jgi:hypothetical protein
MNDQQFPIHCFNCNCDSYWSLWAMAAADSVTCDICGDSLAQEASRLLRCLHRTDGLYPEDVERQAA